MFVRDRQYRENNVLRMLSANDRFFQIGHFGAPVHLRKFVPIHRPMPCSASHRFVFKRTSSSITLREHRSRGGCDDSGTMPLPTD